MKRHLQTVKGRAKDSKELPPQVGYMGGRSTERRGEGARTEVPQPDLRAEHMLIMQGWVTEGRQSLKTLKTELAGH